MYICLIMIAVMPMTVKYTTGYRLCAVPKWAEKILLEVEGARPARAPVTNSWRRQYECEVGL